MQMDSMGEKIYIPAAFVLSLTADAAALRAFSRMPPGQQNAVIAGACRLKTQEEMDKLLHELVQ